MTDLPTQPVFCLLSDVKSAMPLNPNWSGHDSSLGSFAVAATLQMQEICKRTFIANDPTSQQVEFFATQDRIQQQSLYLQSRTNMEFYPKELNVDPTSIDLRLSYNYAWDDPTGEGYSQVVPQTSNMSSQYGYMVEPIGNYAMRITVIAQTYAHPKALRLKYNAGWTLGTPDPATGYALVAVPSALARATALQAAFLANRFAEASEGAERTGGAKYGKRFTPTAQGGLLPEAENLMRQFRRSLTNGV